GHFVRRLGRSFVASGFERSPYALERARGLNPGATFYGQLADLPSASFAGLCCLHVLEHIDDAGLDEVLATWRRMLAPGGRVLCVVPDVGGRGRAIKAERWFAYRDATHINLKSRLQYRALFASRGFAVVAEGTDGLWDFPYRPGFPRWLDLAWHATPTVLQFLSGRLLLSAGSGESAVFILERMR
uniref:class I SAM-dependent methyltransferase n=1 Tax=Chitinimonas sp. TaxID=1934313 RepID=UPI0035B1D32D